MQRFSPRLALLPLTMWGFLSCDQQSPKTGPEKIPQQEYSYDNPGQWDVFKETHQPQLEYRNTSEGNLMVFVTYKDRQPQHKVEVIGIIDENMRDVVPAVKFGAWQEYYQAVFTVDSFRSEMEGIR
jgi:hypothetical protein